MHSGVLYRSHRGIPPFRLHRPRAVAEALAALAAARGPAAYLAGGVDLVPAMRSDARVTEVIFLGGIAELTTITRQNGTLHVGAGVSHERFARDARVVEGLPQLPALWRRLGNIRVRLAGTIGGNMMAAKPTYDVLPVLLSLDAKVTFTSLDSAGAPRTITTEPSQRPAPGALLQHIEIPAGSRRYIGFDRSLKPVVSLALAVEETPSGLAGRAAVGCAYPAPVCRPGWW